MLPAGVRRRLSRRDGRLPAILMGELMAGMALGMVWPVLTSPPPPIPQTAVIAVRAPVPVVPQTPPLPAPVYVPKHAPRNPFGVPQGIDAARLPGAVAQPQVAAPAAAPQVVVEQSPAAPYVVVAPAPVAPAPVRPPVAPPVAPPAGELVLH